MEIMDWLLGFLVKAALMVVVVSVAAMIASAVWAAIKMMIKAVKEDENGNGER